MKKNDWTRKADEIAAFAHTHRFSTRRNIEVNRGKVVYWDNNPVGTRRPVALDHIKGELDAMGISTLGQGFSPTEGPDAGYTVALVFDADETRIDTVEDVVRKHLVAQRLGGNIGMSIM